MAGIRRMGGMGEGDTQMTRLRRLLVRTLVGALVLLSLGASVASADPGISGSPHASTQAVPEDPGFSE